MMGKKISIVVPVYKVEAFLEASINSIINQTYPNLEIILVDDGSPDKCAQICDELATKDDRIKVIHKENGGVSSARNAGLDMVTGDYIMFVDSDDTINPQMVEILYNILVEMNADVSMCSWKKVNDIHHPKDKIYVTDKHSCVVFENNEVFDLLYNKKVPMIAAVWAKLYKKDIFDSIRFPLGKIHEDEATIHQILNECNKAVYVDYTMYNNTQRENSITSAAFNMNRLNALIALQQRIDFVKEKKLDFLDVTINQYVKISILYYYMSKWANFEEEVLNNIEKEISKYYQLGYGGKLAKMFFKHPKILGFVLKIRQKNV